MVYAEKMFNFFNRKDGRKILERKDSDAGDSDLWRNYGLLYLANCGINSSSWWGPTVALTFNFLVSVSIISMNKLVLISVGFNYPIFLTFIHYICSWLLIAILKALSILLAPPSKSTKYSFLVALGIVMSLSTGLANVSLKFNSVGFYQMDKIAVKPAIVLAEFNIFRKRIYFLKLYLLVSFFEGGSCGIPVLQQALNFYVCLHLVSIGVAVATVTDLQFHFFGACIAVAWIIPSAVNKILRSSLQQQENWNALALIWKTTPITLCFLLILMPYLDPPGVFSFNWSFHNSSIIFASAVLGFLLQWSGALALGETSAITHVGLGHNGQFNTRVILVGGFLLFCSNPGTSSICGAITALGGGMPFYTHLNLLKQQQSIKTSSRQSTFSLPKSRLRKQNGDFNDQFFKMTNRATDYVLVDDI